MFRHRDLSRIWSGHMDMIYLIQSPRSWAMSVLTDRRENTPKEISPTITPPNIHCLFGVTFIWMGGNMVTAELKRCRPECRIVKLIPFGQYRRGQGDSTATHHVGRWEDQHGRGETVRIVNFESKYIQSGMMCPRWRSDGVKSWSYEPQKQE